MFAPGHAAPKIPRVIPSWRVVEQGARGALWGRRLGRRGLNAPKRDIWAGGQGRLQRGHCTRSPNAARRAGRIISRTVGRGISKSVVAAAARAKGAVASLARKENAAAR
ncbi:MAG: hypothetical protein ACI9ZM_000445 [Paracoccaceae bacterium]